MRNIYAMCIYWNSSTGEQQSQSPKYASNSCLSPSHHKSMRTINLCCSSHCANVALGVQSPSDSRCIVGDWSASQVMAAAWRRLAATRRTAHAQCADEVTQDEIPGSNLCESGGKSGKMRRFRVWWRLRAVRVTRDCAGRARNLEWNCEGFWTCCGRTRLLRDW